MSEGAGAGAPAAGDPDQDRRQGPETQRGGPGPPSPGRREVCRRLSDPAQPHHRGRQAPSAPCTRSAALHINPMINKVFVDIIITCCVAKPSSKHRGSNLSPLKIIRHSNSECNVRRARSPLPMPPLDEKSSSNSNSDNRKMPNGTSDVRC